MKNNTIKKTGLKAVFVLTLALAGFNAQAQDQSTAITKQPSTTLPQVGDGTALTQGSVRVIDNKGTIKYLQVKNGITQITNAAPSGGIVTTWQLGGTLTDNTYIDASNKVFALDGITLVTNEPASTDAGDKTKHGTGTGLTLLVRNEATGETMKMKFSDLVNGGQTVITAATATNATFTDDTLPATVQKVWVYRNGAKLVAGQDYSLAGTTVTVNFENITVPDDYAFITGDKIEIQWVK
ncbi:hypothetical protein [Flavobacterium quisquiliarum]|uniref:Uncharacterized protein n=1 Tax=Flavobacterium quisquiliarum TaxID=1834436 RepID=A0ABV8W2V7_9FLAO|nr:hypothetical protein [Flavobacterium quisquiliarum]MBW1655406.1 hypothetical protein [Flavobacterium quisquiliarum]NWL03030.1 hypothetical protein [Flavobacterium collinsii]